VLTTAIGTPAKNRLFTRSSRPVRAVTSPFSTDASNRSFLGPGHVRGDLRADPAETTPAQGRRDASLLVADAHQPAVLLDRPADVQAMCRKRGV